MERRAPGVKRSRARGRERGVTGRTRAIGYVRVSLEKQANEGHSLAAQERKLREYASLYDLELVEIVVDAGASAKSLDRPGLTRALEQLRAGAADALLVVKLDRLTRSVRDLGDLVEGYFGADRPFALLSVADQIDTRSAAGRLVLNVLASVSQWEREAIGERPSVVMQDLRSKGRYTGGDAPYGYARGEGGRLDPVQSEQAAVALARDSRARGLTLRAVAADLDAAG